MNLLSCICSVVATSICLIIITNVSWLVPWQFKNRAEKIVTAVILGLNIFAVISTVFLTFLCFYIEY